MAKALSAQAFVMHSKDINVLSRAAGSFSTIHFDWKFNSTMTQQLDRV